MQWNGSRFAGFSTNQPWLPVHPDYLERNVATQKANPNSIFAFTKKLINIRRNTPALRSGRFVPIKTPKGSMAYVRQLEEQSVLVAMNFSGHRVKLNEINGHWQTIFSTLENEPGVLDPWEIQLSTQV
jgi:alpha-glucosidase